MTADSSGAAASMGREVTRHWWLFILTGVLWLIYAFVVLSASVNTVWAVAVLFGIGFIVGGVVELSLASFAQSWKWLHVLFGAISIVAGVVALVWPGQTFLVLAAITGWFLLFDGMVNVVVSVVSRSVNELWWLGLILGIAEILIGFWAVGYIGRSIALLVVFVAAGALARGISSLVTGFTLHGADKELRRALGSASA
jgi:uncharacterized membrane protein HdeD (DUF308 family)